ncbi:hypothetical protein [Pseudomonas helvetica]|uniref:hypothetical protein n=1 Tax=Pseudomonas helvetica TaxID=3136738 RepID=UPI003263408B
MPDGKLFREQHTSGNGSIDAAGRLDLNAGVASAVDAKGKGIKSIIDAAVKALFPENIRSFIIRPTLDLMMDHQF